MSFDDYPVFLSLPHDGPGYDPTFLS